MNEHVTILHVDDRPDDLWLFSIAFDKSGITGTVVSLVSTQAAILYLNRMGEYAQAARPDRIILDYEMPWMNGKQLIDVIRSTETFKNIPIVLLSGADPDVLARDNPGVDAIVVKPNNIEGLIALMPTLMGPLTSKIYRVPRTSRTPWR